MTVEALAGGRKPEIPDHARAPQRFREVGEPPTFGHPAIARCNGPCSLPTALLICPARGWHDSLSGKEMPVRDLAGLARSVQDATSVPQGASFDERDEKFIQLPRRPSGDECDAGAAGDRDNWYGLAQAIGILQNIWITECFTINRIK